MLSSLPVSNFVFGPRESLLLTALNSYHPLVLNHSISRWFNTQRVFSEAIVVLVMVGIVFSMVGLTWLMVAV